VSPRDNGGMVRRLLVAVAVVTLAGAALVAWHRRSPAQAPARVSAIAGEIAHRKVTVRCSDLGTGGCALLRDYDRARLGCFERRVPCSEQALRTGAAVLALTRIGIRERGVRAAAIRECYALQQLAFTALRLGSPPGEAQAMAGSVFARNTTTLPRGCVDDGPLDVDPATHSWPSG
jgi:hypothetical protein